MFILQSYVEKCFVLVKKKSFPIPMRLRADAESIAQPRCQSAPAPIALVRFIGRRLLCLPVVLGPHTAQRCQSLLHGRVPHPTGVERPVEITRESPVRAQMRPLRPAACCGALLRGIGALGALGGGRLGRVLGAVRVQIDPAAGWSVFTGAEWVRVSYQRGHVPDTLSSHGSTHSGWNWWLHGSTRRSCPLTKSSVQMGQEKLFCSVVAAAVCCCCCGCGGDDDDVLSSAFGVAFSVGSSVDSVVVVPVVLLGCCGGGGGVGAPAPPVAISASPVGVCVSPSGAISTSPLAASTLGS